MTLPIEDFADNLDPVGSGIGPPLSASFFNALVDAVEGKAPLVHTHPVGDITAAGIPSSLTYLRGDGSWATPPGTGSGGGAVASVNTKTGAVVLGHADVGATRVVVDGTYAEQFEVDTTPVTAADVGAYTSAQTDSAIAAATAQFAPVVSLTQAAYNALTPVPGTLYIVTG